MPAATNPEPSGRAQNATRIAAIGDLHVSDSPKTPCRELFAEISDNAHILALCGDLTNLGTIAEAEILAEDLQSCSIPTIAVLGNHDHESGHASEVMAILRQAGTHLLEDHAFALESVGFAGVKGFGGGFGRRMLGSFGEAAIKHFVNESVAEAMHLENELRSLTTDKLVVVLHYSPIRDTLIGEVPEIYPFLGSSRLGETIDRFDVSCAVHGHAHHGTFEGKTLKGIPVYNCAQTIAKPGGRPYALIQL